MDPELVTYWRLDVRTAVDSRIIAYRGSVVGYRLAHTGGPIKCGMPYVEYARLVVSRRSLLVDTSVDACNTTWLANCAGDPCACLARVVRYILCRLTAFHYHSRHPRTTEQIPSCRSGRHVSVIMWENESRCCNCEVIGDEEGGGCIFIATDFHCR